MSNNELLNEIKKLSIAERILIVESIWDSIASTEEDISVPDDHKIELDNRLNDYETNPSDTVGWNELKKRLHNKL